MLLWELSHRFLLLTLSSYSTFFQWEALDVPFCQIKRTGDLIRQHHFEAFHSDAVKRFFVKIIIKSIVTIVFNYESKTFECILNFFKYHITFRIYLIFVQNSILTYLRLNSCAKILARYSWNFNPKSLQKIEFSRWKIWISTKNWIKINKSGSCILSRVE